MDVALSRERAPDVYRETLRACLRAASRMSGVVDGLLSLARTEADERASLHTEVDLGPLVLETIELLRPEVERRQLTLSHELHPAIVLGNAHRLGVVVSNLLSNAIDYNRPGGQIEVRLSESAGQVRLTAGIPASASRAARCPASSSPSTGSTTPARATVGERGSASLSRSRSSKRTQDP